MTAVAKQHDSIWCKNFILLCLANLTLFLSIQILLPTLPLYMTYIGGAQSDIGYIMGAYTIGAMLMRFFAGWLVDHYGRKKNIVLGLTIMLATTFFYGFARTMPTLIAIRALHGITFGLASTGIGTMAADSLPVSRMGEGIGYFGLASTLSMALAPVIGLWLIGSFNYQVLFLVGSLFTFLTLVNGVFVADTDVPLAISTSPKEGSLANFLEKTALLPSSVAFFIAFVYSAVIYFIAVYAASLGIGNVGPFFSAFAVAMLVSRPISGRLADSGKNNLILFLGLITMFISIIMISFSETNYIFIFAGSTFGIGFGLSLPTLQAMAVRQAPAHRRGAATGTYFMAFDMGLGIGSILWGYIAEAAGFRIMYFTSLIPLFISGAIYFKYKSSKIPAANITNQG